MAARGGGSEQWLLCWGLSLRAGTSFVMPTRCDPLLMGLPGILLTMLYSYVALLTDGWTCHVVYFVSLCVWCSHVLCCPWDHLRVVVCYIRFSLTLLHRTAPHITYLIERCSHSNRVSLLYPYCNDLIRLLSTTTLIHAPCRLSD